MPKTVLLKFILAGLAVIGPFDQGYAEAQSPGISQEQAVEGYRKAAERGDAQAQFRLGMEYHLAERVPQDYAKAAWWWRKAANQGHAEANRQSMPISRPRGRSRLMTD